MKASNKFYLFRFSSDMFYQECVPIPDCAYSLHLSARQTTTLISGEIKRQSKSEDNQTR